MRGHQIDPGCVAHLAVAIVEINKKKGRQGHDFPGQQKEHGVARAHDHHHAQQEQEIKEPVRAQIVLPRRGMAQGQTAGNGADHAQTKDRQQKDAAQRVKAQNQSAGGQAPGQFQNQGRVPGAGRHGAKAREAAQGRAA